MKYFRPISFTVIFLLFIYVLIISSCNETKEQYLNTDCYKWGKSNFKNEVDTFALESNYRYLNINSISLTSDTFKFRVHYSSSDSAKIFEYFYYQGIETFKVYAFPAEPRGKILFDKNIDDIKKFTTVFDAKERGLSFFKILKANHILELGDTLKFKDYTVEQYPIAIIEVSNKCRHEILVFTDVPSFKEKYLKAKYVSNFLSYLRTEFKM